MDENMDYRCGWVALMGPPNAGKSTLLNALLGQKVAIATPKPQTTRNQIVGILTDKVAQVIFMDTPGVAKLRGALNKTMLQAVWESLSQANVIMLVLDANLYIRHPEDLESDLAPVREALAEDKRPLIVAPNKIDLFADKSKMLPLLTRIGQIWPNAEIFPISALNHDGLEALKTLVESKLPEGPAIFPEDQISTAPMRFLAAEIIREKLYMRLRQEVPYGVAVEVESWDEDPARNLIVIHAVIYVSRPMYKPMILGKEGSVIKEIGTQSRLEIEELTDRRVHLELFVKVRENWQDDPAFVHNLNQGARPVGNDD